MTKSMGDDWLGVPALANELGVTMRTAYEFLDRVKVRPGELSHLYPPGEYDGPPKKG